MLRFKVFLKAKNIMKKIKYFIILGLLIISTTNCKDYLNINPKGIILESTLSDPQYIEGLITSAYAFRSSTGYYGTYGSTLNPWIASVRSDDAYKGGGSLDDQTPWYQMEVFTLVNNNVGNNNGPWNLAYLGISRCNAALRALNSVDEAAFPLKTIRIAEMRFQRGLIYFKLKERFKWAPIFDETLTTEQITKVPNRPEGATNDLGLWQKIYDDFRFAADNLPGTQPEVGRANKYAAESFLAKTLLWMAYPQDLNNQVTGLDATKLTEALKYCDDIINSGKYGLCTDFAKNFLPEYDNNTSESIFEVQYSINDGADAGQLNKGNEITAPWWTPYFSCCDFNKASYNMVNAFRVDANGLPLFDTFNDAEITNKNVYFNSNAWDPRLSHTVAIPGYPWKYQTAPLLKYDSAGSRKPEIYGYMHNMKDNVSTDCPCLYKPFFIYNSMNLREVRFDEVLLYKAEILIKLGRHMEALPIINQIRQRADGSTQKLKYENGSPFLNYKVGQYLPGVNCTWDGDFAWKALVWESRLEMAMEGRRFFDLVRWGIAKDIMNAYFDKEGNRRSWLKIGRFNSGRDEFLPIPQVQIDRAKGVYIQNPGY
jgi:starch-binding outer membrane protein, SusD/RagB family